MRRQSLGELNAECTLLACPLIFSPFLFSLRDVPYNMTQFGVYYSIVKYLRRNADDGELSLWQNFAAGGCAGTCAWGIVYPLDVLKSRQQAGSTVPRRSLRDVFSGIYRKEGLRGFYHGYSAGVLRAFPANAGLFGGVEVSRRIVHHYHDKFHEEPDDLCV